MTDALARLQPNGTHLIPLKLTINDLARLGRAATVTAATLAAATHADTGTSLVGLNGIRREAELQLELADLIANLITEHNQTIEDQRADERRRANRKAKTQP